LILRLFLFWMFLFQTFRIWFILWFKEEWSTEHSASVWKALWKAFPLDASMAAYLMVLPVLLYYLGLLIGRFAHAIAHQVIHSLNLVLLFVCIGVLGANVFIYEEWHTLLNTRAIQYLSSPSALFNSLSWTFTLALTALYLITFWAFSSIYRFWLGNDVYARYQRRVYSLSFFPTVALLFLAIRGGWGVMPVNESAVYYSDHLFNNHAATNPVWHLAHSLMEVRTTQNKYKAFETTEALQLKEQLFQTGTPIASRFWSSTEGPSKPNIVLIVLESMTAQVIKELGCEEGVCPNLSQLIQEGLLVEQCYSSGYRTDQGIVSILSGYPAQPDQSVILHTDKVDKLQSLPRLLKEKYGYSTAFLYGGELTFANMGAWLSSQRFNPVMSQEDFTSEEVTQRWGADDQMLFKKTLQTANTLPEPFLMVPLSLSLHPPYDVPYKSQWTGKDERSQFLNSAAFVDQAIGQFFNQAKEQPWYSNTLFVLVADHGSSNPAGLGLEQPLTRRIPLLFFAPFLSEEVRGKRLNVMGNHHDIPATLLHLLGLEEQEASHFPWSRNLLQKEVSSGFAFYTNEDGLGWVTSTGAGFFRFQSQEWQFFGESLDDTQKRSARAYLQTLYDDYLGL
jgi:phosphoglycerol transferase MdoB-like AlkP superfamily enzyme